MEVENSEDPCLSIIIILSDYFFILARIGFRYRYMYRSLFVRHHLTSFNSLELEKYLYSPYYIWFTIVIRRNAQFFFPRVCIIGNLFSSHYISRVDTYYRFLRTIDRDYNTTIGRYAQCTKTRGVQPGNNKIYKICGIPVYQTVHVAV